MFRNISHLDDGIGIAETLELHNAIGTKVVMSSATRRKLTEFEKKLQKSKLLLQVLRQLKGKLWGALSYTSNESLSVCPYLFVSL